MFAIASLMVGSVINANINQTIRANLTDEATNLQDRPDIQLVVTLTFLVGLILVAMSFLQIHVFASYLSDSMNSGWTCASAIHVIMTQVPALLGIKGFREKTGFLKIYYASFEFLNLIVFLRI